MTVRPAAFDRPNWPVERSTGQREAPKAPQQALPARLAALLRSEK